MNTLTGSPEAVKNLCQQSLCWVPAVCGGSDLWNGWILSLEWKTEGLIGGESLESDD